MHPLVNRECKMDTNAYEYSNFNNIREDDAYVDMLLNDAYKNGQLAEIMCGKEYVAMQGMIRDRIHMHNMLHQINHSIADRLQNKYTQSFHLTIAKKKFHP